MCKKRALRIVFNDRILDYSDLLKKANTCTIETRWKRQLETEVYKAVNGLTPSYISEMFQKKKLTTIKEDPNSSHNLNSCLKLMAIIL